MESKEEQCSLKWSNFGPSVTEGFRDLWQEETMVDVTLAAGGAFLQAHRLVLSVCSPYFKNLFMVNPCKHPIVFLKDVNRYELENILEFMYKGEVGVKNEELSSFLKLAENLKVRGLAGKDYTLESKENRKVSSRVRKKRIEFSSDSDSENLRQYKPKLSKAIRKRKRRILRSSEQDKAGSSYNAVRKEKRMKQDIKGTVSGGDAVQHEDDNDDEDPLVRLMLDKIKDDSKTGLPVGNPGEDNGLDDTARCSEPDDDNDDDDDDDDDEEVFGMPPMMYNVDNSEDADQPQEKCHLIKTETCPKEEKANIKSATAKARLEKIKSDPILLAKYKEKERLKYLNKKKKGQRKSIQDMTPREQRNIRKQWKMHSTNYRKKKYIRKDCEKSKELLTPESKIKQIAKD